MTDAMIIEAVRAVGGSQSTMDANQVAGPAAVANPAAVERFQAAMAIDGVSAVDKVADPIPFASQMSGLWQSAQVNNQGILHRIRALSELSTQGGLSAPEMLELQYEVMNLSFQQEVVTKVADKASNAVQTLIKNQ